MSLYAEYLRERSGDHIVETSQGFATYRFLNETQVYLVDLYVKSEFRKLGVASSLADIVVMRAKDRGCKEILGTVVPSMKGSTTSLMALLGYGMTLQSAGPDLIVFRKDI